MQRLKSVRLSDPPEHHWLVISDSQTALQAAKAAGRAVLGILTAANPQEAFDGILYLAEEKTPVSDEFAERIVRRHLGLPWQIAVTKRLILRELTAQDIPALYLLYGPADDNTGASLAADRQDEIDKFYAYQKYSYQFFEYGLWAVIERTGGQLIGRAGLSRGELDGEQELFVEYQIMPGKRRQGYGKEAVEAVLQYAKDDLAAASICLRIHKNNQPSLRLAESLGFIPEQKGQGDIQYFRYLF